MKNSPNRSSARIAGLLYLVPMFVGPFSMMYVPSVVLARGDAALTAQKLVASQALFRAGLVGDVAIVLSELALTGVLYVLLRRAGRTLALVATFARLAMTIVQAVNVLPNLAALALATGDAGMAGSIDPAQRQALVLIALDLHGQGVHIWEALFSLHCVLVGILTLRGGLLPRVLGALMVVAGAGYALNGLGNLIAPTAGPVLAGIVGVTALVGEVPFVFWLLVKGVAATRSVAGHEARLLAEAT